MWGHSFRGAQHTAGTQAPGGSSAPGARGRADTHAHARPPACLTHAPGKIRGPPAGNRHTRPPPPPPSEVNKPRTHGPRAGVQGLLSPSHVRAHAAPGPAWADAAARRPALPGPVPSRPVPPRPAQLGAPDLRAPLPRHPASGRGHPAGPGHDPGHPALRPGFRAPVPASEPFPHPPLGPLRLAPPPPSGLAVPARRPGPGSLRSRPRVAPSRAPESAAPSFVVGRAARGAARSCKASFPELLTHRIPFIHKNPVMR